SPGSAVPVADGPTPAQVRAREQQLAAARDREQALLLASTPVSAAPNNAPVVVFDTPLSAVTADSPYYVDSSVGSSVPTHLTGDCVTRGPSFRRRFHDASPPVDGLVPVLMNGPAHLTTVPMDAPSIDAPLTAAVFRSASTGRRAGGVPETSGVRTTPAVAVAHSTVAGGGVGNGAGVQHASRPIIGLATRPEVTALAIRGGGGPRIAQNRLLDLLRRDQLTVQRAHARAFAGYTEGEVTFAPTYKYNNGTHTYDTSEKNRIPAWCNRILYKSLAKLNLVVYKRAELLVSDHKPVLALFRTPVTVVDHAKKQALYQDLLRGMTGGGAAANPFRAILAAQQTQQQTREAQLISFDDDGGTRRLPPPSTDTSSEPWWAAFPPLQDTTTLAPTAATTLARPEPAALRPAAPAAPATSAAASMPALGMFDPWRAASPTPALGAGVRAGASVAVSPQPAPAEGWSLLD
ncbi:hypothetical protein GGF32_005792, partial [Allomyces javanicus]